MNTLFRRARQSTCFRSGTLVLVAVALALPVAATASSSSVSESKAQTAFRKEFLSYLTQMQQVSVMLQGNPQGRAALSRLGVNPSSAFPRARAGVLRMTPEQLAVLQAAFAGVPNWQRQPAVLKATLRRNGFTSRGRVRAFAVGPDCDPGPGTPLGITDFYIAAGVALGLEVAHVAIPDDILTSPAQIAAALAWGVAAGAALTLEGLNAVEAECDGAKLEDFTRTQLDAKISTRATQTSVDSFNASFNTFVTSFNTLSTLINSRLDVAVSTRATQASLNAFQAEFTANAAVVNTKLDGITSSLTSAHNKLDGITSSLASVHNKLDSLAVVVNDQGKLALRMQIEADLSEPGNHPVALFETPASAGGYLGVTRDIVVDTIAKMKASGQGVGGAEAFLASADAAVAAGDYKGAYTDYGKAYRAAATK